MEATTEFYVGESPEAFEEEPAVTATFGKVRTAQSANLKSPVTARLVKVRALSEINGGPWASAAEIGVIGKSVKP